MPYREASEGTRFEGTTLEALGRLGDRFKMGTCRRHLAAEKHAKCMYFIEMGGEELGERAAGHARQQSERTLGQRFVTNRRRRRIQGARGKEATYGAAMCVRCAHSVGCKVLQLTEIKKSFLRERMQDSRGTEGPLAHDAGAT